MSMNFVEIVSFILEMIGASTVLMFLIALAHKQWREITRL